ncbi:MAG: tetratricopeptide repeat protein [Candidatus Competibacteraceae bacterium]
MSRNRQGRAPQPHRRQTLDVRTSLPKAINLHRNGRLEEAEQLYRRILAVQPANPSALNFLGVLLHQRGDSTEAVRLLERSIAHHSDYADAHNNLGIVLSSLGRFAEAVAAYRRAIGCRAIFPEAYNNLGVELRLQGDLEEAIQVLRQGIAIKPDYADAYISLGRALREADQLDAAIQAFQEGLRHNPRNPYGYRQLGRLLYSLNRIEEAVACFREWTRHHPDDPEAWHMLAAVTGENVPVRAADDYMQALFDRFADNFDQQLRRLDYRAPSLLAAAIAMEWETPNPVPRVLDAGCGTGLCGPLLRPYARYLIGVDLSPGMIAKAQGRNVYDELVVAELTAFMREQTDGFDLIVSADTLVYFGDLEPPLRAAAAVLSPDGLLAFTVERLVDGAEDFHLNPSGRYAHSLPYLHRLLQSAGLTPLSIVSADLRLEGGQPVGGYVVLARKSPGPASVV